jgi:hypothetical protein
VPVGIGIARFSLGMAQEVEVHGSRTMPGAFAGSNSTSSR